MNIRIRVHGRQPLTGYAGREGEMGRRFFGWLGLLRILLDEVSSGGSRSIGEFSPGGDPQLGEHVRDVSLDRASRDE